MPRRAFADTPRSSNSNSPQKSGPSASHWPVLAPMKVTVNCAATATGCAMPVKPLRPEGISIATRGTGAALIAAISCCQWSSRARCKPMPSRPSTISWPSICCPCQSCSTPPACRQRSAKWRAVADWRDRSPCTSICTSTPSSSAQAATTKASPPLLPEPANTVMRSTSGQRARSACQTRLPARCISSISARPSTATAAWSSR